jgi:hypothetical protein
MLLVDDICGRGCGLDVEWDLESRGACVGPKVDGGGGSLGAKHWLPVWCGGAAGAIGHSWG